MSAEVVLVENSESEEPLSWEEPNDPEVVGRVAIQAETFLIAASLTEEVLVELVQILLHIDSEKEEHIDSKLVAVPTQNWSSLETSIESLEEENEDSVFEYY